MKNGVFVIIFSRKCEFFLSFCLFDCIYKNIFICISMHSSLITARLLNQLRPGGEESLIVIREHGLETHNQSFQFIPLIVINERCNSPLIGAARSAAWHRDATGSDQGLCGPWAFCWMAVRRWQFITSQDRFCSACSVCVHADTRDRTWPGTGRTGLVLARP